MRLMTWAWTMAMVLGLGAGVASATDQKVHGQDQDTYQKDQKAGAGSDVGDELGDRPIKQMVDDGQITSKELQKGYQSAEKNVYVNTKHATLGTTKKDIQELRQKVQKMGGDHTALLKDLDDLEARNERISERLGVLKDSKSKDWSQDRKQIDQMLGDFNADFAATKARINSMYKSR